MLVDDHEVVRLGLKSLLEQQPNFRVVAEAATESEAVMQAAAHEPDIVLMDIRLVGGSGIKACEEIVKANAKIKVLMLTSYAEDELLFAAIKAGASGYVLKQISGSALVRSIEAAARGETTLDPSLTGKVFAEMRRSLRKEEAAVFQELTNQELQVLRLLTDGKTNREIGATLHLSEGTVRNYVSSILSKLDVANRVEAAAFAIHHHLEDYI